MTPEILPSTIAKASDDMLVVASDRNQMIYSVELLSSGVLMEGKDSPITMYLGQSQSDLSMCQSQNIVYVSFGSRSNESCDIYMFCLDDKIFTRVVSSNEGFFEKTQYLAAYKDGIAFTDCETRQIRLFCNGEFSILAGTGKDGNQDGSSLNASFLQLLGYRQTNLVLSS
ncbi:unnamed protein product [Mytilus coruscus]|uniref:Uncharacterized protein n=1 Tax=Mytilus coruscus TaxID=42192 RepID=A0A6J8B3A9_MYTCO|nr:unnamed protein product [Mytilus coruscus]